MLVVGKAVQTPPAQLHFKLSSVLRATRTAISPHYLLYICHQEFSSVMSIANLIQPDNHQILCAHFADLQSLSSLANQELHHRSLLRSKSPLLTACPRSIHFPKLLEKVFEEGTYLPPSFADGCPRQRHFFNIPVQPPLATSLVDSEISRIDSPNFRVSSIFPAPRSPTVV